MKILALIVALFFAVNSIAVAPYGFRGQNQTAVQYSNVLQFPNSQVTKLAGINSLVETGNTNILVNPSFEHSSFLTGWTEAGTGTDSAEASVVIQGLKSLMAVTSAQTINLSQSSTLYQAQFADGVQGLLMVRIKTNHTGAINVCSINAGVVSTTSCVAVAADNKWGLYKVPFILGATSNGISIVGASGTGTTYVDDTFVGAVDLKTDSVQAFKLGSIRFASCSGNWSNGSTAYATLGTNSCTVTTTGSVSAPLTGVPGFRILNRQAGKYKFEAYGRFAKTLTTTNSVMGFRFQDLTNSVGAAENQFEVSPSVGASLSIPYIGGSLDYTNSGDTSYEIYAKTSVTTSSTLAAILAASSAPDLVIDVYYYPPQSSSYSASCGANCVDTFRAFVDSSGVVSNENIDWINGNGSVSSPTTTLTLNTGIFTVNQICNVTPSSSTELRISVNSISSIQVQQYTSAGINSSGGFFISCSKTGADFIASRTITGSFAEVPTVPTVTSPVFFGAVVNATCSASPCTIAQPYGSTITSITRTSTGLYNLIMSGLSVTPLCHFNSTETSAGNSAVTCHRTATRSSTSYTFSCKQGTTFIDYNFEVNCMGQK